MHSNECKQVCYTPVVLNIAVCVFEKICTSMLQTVRKACIALGRIGSCQWDGAVIQLSVVDWYDGAYLRVTGEDLWEMHVIHWDAGKMG